MADSVALHAFIYGNVQGTYFRAYASGKATGLGLNGYVRNLPDGSVEVMAEGPKDRLEKLIGYLNIGSPTSRVDRVVTSWSEAAGQYTGFKIKYG